ncbi:MAG: threonine synthase [Actinobacteria bacterium]|nr:threonine synthase [Actinomycetota bacterium]
MQYISTRGQAPTIGFCDVLLAGLARDGGLYVPETWPKLIGLTGGASVASTKNSAAVSYAQRAAQIMSPFVGDEIDRQVFERLCVEAYSTFRHKDVAPLVEIAPNEYLLELFHGPTLAFKDIALQLVGKLFDFVLAQRNERVMIVGATSGDTGGAAFDGVASCRNVDIVMLYPNNRVSDVQRRQMTTLTAPNVHAVAVDGTFDDCQDLVKAMFNDQKFRDANRLSAVNSINWVRVMAQVVYYITAIEKLGRSAVFSVPTGNFGNVLAGWIAKQMGAQIEGFVVASNTNDILTRFFESQSMVANEVVPTLSPSMDIQVSSNFERLLFETNDRDGVATGKQLTNFRATGKLDVAKTVYQKWISGVFAGRRCDDEQTLATMQDVYRQSAMLIDPHTAVGLCAARHSAGVDYPKDLPMITLATAHPAKFPDAVRRATGQTPQLPDHLADLMSRPERSVSLPNDLKAVQAFVGSCRN